MSDSTRCVITITEAEKGVIGKVRIVTSHLRHFTRLEKHGYAAESLLPEGFDVTTLNDDEKIFLRKKSMVDTIELIVKIYALVHLYDDHWRISGVDMENQLECIINDAIKLDGSIYEAVGDPLVSLKRSARK